MTIGIDCRAMQGRGGIAHYTYNLVKHLLLQDRKNQYVLFFDTKISQNTRKEFEQNNCSIQYYPNPKYKKVLPLVYSHFIVSNFLKKQKLDLIHFPASSAPLGYRGKFVITVHDFAIYNHPEWFPPCQWFSKKIIVPSSLKKAQKIIAVSRTIKRDITKIFGVSEKKIKVIYEAGFSHLSLRGGRSLALLGTGSAISSHPPNFPDENYILFIGTLEPRKNLGRLIRAFALYRRKYPEAKEKLMIVGGEGWKFKDIFSLVRQSKLQREIKFTGFCPEKEKIRLLKKAKVFIFPSLYEGFGLPVLEAMSLGVPVICSSRGALREIAGDTAYLINPQNVYSIFNGLTQVLRNKGLRKELAKRGLERAQHFSWQKCALETLGVYNSQ